MRFNIYSNRLLFQLTMRLLYGVNFSARYKAVAKYVPDRSQVVDVCSGDSYIYTKYLREREIDYLGLELNPLRQHAQKKGVTVREFDLWKNTVPISDIVILQASLYQFIPDQKKIVSKLLKSTRQRLIIAEPITNLSSSRNPLIANLAKKLTMPGKSSSETQYQGERFNRATLISFFESFEEFQFFDEIPGGEGIGRNF